MGTATVLDLPIAAPRDPAPEPVAPMPALLERLPTGVMLLAADASVRFANRAARAVLAAGSVGLRIDGDRVVAADRSVEPAWRAALADALRGTTRMARLGARPAVALSPWPDRPARVVCTLPPADAHETTSLRAYAAAHGLSPGETDVLCALARGLPPKRVARLRGSTELTVRTQVKSILQKTGHHGIREVVVDALRSAPVPLTD